MSARARLPTQGESRNPSAPTETIPAPAEVELPKERIEAAFGAPKDTHFGSNVLSDGELTVARPTTATMKPSGLRLGVPPGGNRLIGFITEQRWQGYVTAVQDHTFLAIVHDESPDYSDEIEEVEFDREDVAELMRPLIRPGAVFFWDIGFQVEPSGQRTRQSILSFPMIPVHTQERINQALVRGRGRFIDLGWDKSSAQNASDQSEESS
jgi:hypothetical protein